VFILAGNAILIFFIVSSGISNFLNNDSVELKKPDPQIVKKETVLAKTNTFIPSPTQTPTPTPMPSITPTPTNVPAPTSTESNKEDSEIVSAITNIPQDTSGNVGLTLMKQINDFRASNELPTLSTDGYTCAFATLRAGEITGSFNHDGFRSRLDSNSLPYPSYSSVAENIAMNSDANAVVPGWIASPGHNENLRKDVPYGCVGVSGDYYVFQAWKP
jgi:uncharacterized protein YkwD